MDFLPLIDQPLKSQQIIELLEIFDLDVVYLFDRLFEGTDDEYSVEATEHGFEFTFDAAQRLATVFLFMHPRGARPAVDVASLDVPVYDSVETARMAFEQAGYEIKQGGQHWIKAFADGVWRHYSFHDGRPSMITLMRDPI